MISGLVVHLSPDSCLAHDAVAAMDDHMEVEVGDRHGQRIPVVVESATNQSIEATTDWIRMLPGVLHIDVVYVNFDDQGEDAHASD